MPPSAAGDPTPARPNITRMESARGGTSEAGPDVTGSPGAAAGAGPPPVRTLSLSVLYLLTEAAAAHLGTPLPGGPAGVPEGPPTPNLGEARLAIDAANALLQAVAGALGREERIAVESILTQLQVEYVKRAG